jgi:hypothetical protein
MLDWSQSDALTRAAVVATIAAIVLLVVPPLSIAAALVAAVLSTVVILRARSAGAQTRTPILCLAVSLGLIAVVIVGSYLYARGNP